MWVPHPLRGPGDNRTSWNQLQMAEWFQQQLETRDLQQSQRGCRVPGNSLHVGRVQHPGQQRSWEGTNNNCWWRCQGIFPHLLWQQHPWCMVLTCLPLGRVAHCNKWSNKMDLADDSYVNIDNWKIDYEQQSQHLQPCWLSTSLSAVWTTGFVQQWDVQQLSPSVWYQHLQAFGNLHMDQGLHVVIPIAHQRQVPQQHRCIDELGLPTMLRIWRPYYAIQHGINNVPEAGTICRQQGHQLEARSQRWRSTPRLQQLGEVHLGQQQDGDPATAGQATRDRNSSFGISCRINKRERGRQHGEAYQQATCDVKHQHLVPTKDQQSAVEQHS